MKVYNLYGLKKNETRQYMEDLLISEVPLSTAEKIKDIAARDGFHSFRTVLFNMSKPDFTKVFNVP